VPALFRAGSAPGVTPSKRSPSERYADVTADVNPPAVSPATCATAVAATPRDRPRLLGFDPSGSPLRPRVCLARGLAGCSPGFLPFQGLSATALSSFRRSPLSCFAGRSIRGGRPRQPAPQSINRPSPTSSAPAGEPSGRGRGNPLRVFAPVRSLTFERQPPRAYEFASRRAVRCRRPTDAL